MGIGLVNMGYVDYRTFAKSFEAVMVNELADKLLGNWEEFEELSGSMRKGFYRHIETCDEIDVEEFEELSEEEQADYEYDEHYPDIYQWFVVSDNVLDILEQNNEIVLYFPKYDVNLWGVCHWGTAWNYVTTSIELEKPKHFKVVKFKNGKVTDLYITESRSEIYDLYYESANGRGENYTHVNIEAIYEGESVEIVKQYVPNR